MKNNIFLFSMLATAMLAGCQDAPIPGDNTENYFSFQPESPKHAPKPS